MKIIYFLILIISIMSLLITGLCLPLAVMEFFEPISSGDQGVQVQLAFFGGLLPSAIVLISSLFLKKKLIDQKAKKLQILSGTQIILFIMIYMLTPYVGFLNQEGFLDQKKPLSEQELENLNQILDIDE